jgi:hypothetical protein
MSIRYKQKRRERYNSQLRTPARYDDDGELDIIRCWCGAVGTCEELFSEVGLDETCGGLGVLNCRCGGDLCVCHNHGEVECLGCEDCEEESDEDDEMFDITGVE